MAKPKKEKAPKAEKPGKATEADAEGPQDGEAADGAEAKPKKKLPIKLIAIAAAGGVVLIGAGAVGGLLMSGGGKAHAEAKKAPVKKKAPPKKDEGKKDGPNPISQGPDGVVFYTMPDTVVNIQSPDGRPTYLKLKLAFETPDQDSAEAIGENQMRLNDMFQGFLRELRPDDLSGSQGTYELRQEIQRRVNLVIAPAKVNAVLIQEMLVQ